MTTLDRYILRGLLGNYLIALCVMLSLYVVLDMFVNMDEFTEHGRPLWAVLGDIADFYGPNLLLYFAQLSAAITLFACMATIARMRRLNELTAILASGVSLYRIGVPIIAFGICSAGLLVLDTEVLVPSVAPLLSRRHEDVGSAAAREVLFLPDREHGLLLAANFNPRDKTLHRMLVLKRDEDGAILETLQADLATWEPSETGDSSGRWRLDRGQLRRHEVVEGDQIGPSATPPPQFPRYYESDLTPGEIQMRQAQRWVSFLSLRQLAALQAKGTANLAEVVRTRHGRIVAPILSMVLLLLGLPFFLDRSPANILGATGKCMVVCGLCYVTALVSQSVQSQSASALPFWIPIFIFATVATVLIDRIRT